MSEDHRSTPLFGFLVGRSGKHTLTARQLNGACIAGLGAVLSDKSLDGHLVSRFQCVLGPAVAGQSVGRAAFTLPLHNVSTLLLHVEINPDMRVGPFEFGYGARKLNRLV